jgi:hypothetical protein
MSKYSHHSGQKSTDERFSTMNIDKLKSDLSMGQLLAIMVPIATVISSVAWAISVYAIVRERGRMKVELAHLALESKQYEYRTREDDESGNNKQV